MAIAVFKCDTCDRTIERVLNKPGLAHVGRCVITNGCKGNLHLESTNVSRNVPTPTPSVPGLEDWRARRVLYTHTQQIPSNRWTVIHRLGTIPSVQLFIDPTMQGVEDNFIEVLPEDIIPLDENSLEVVIPESVGNITGVAQCITRTTAGDRQTVAVTPTEALIPLSDVLSFVITNPLTTTTGPEVETLELKLNFVDPTTRNVTSFDVTFTKTTANTPWFGVQKVFVNGLIHELFRLELDLSTDLTARGITSGYGLFITDVSGNPLPNNQNLLLLANSPFDVYDRILTGYIDPANITTANAIESLPLLNGVVNYYPSIIESTYPPIRELT